DAGGADELADELFLELEEGVALALDLLGEEDAAVGDGEEARVEAHLAADDGEGAGDEVGGAGELADLHGGGLVDEPGALQLDFGGDILAPGALDELERRHLGEIGGDHRLQPLAKAVEVGGAAAIAELQH